MTKKLDDLRKLIADLEQAPKGSQELDARIDESQGRTVIWHDVEGERFPRRDEPGCIKLVPNYTTSLDAKLPWEDIVATHRLSDGRFEAADFSTGMTIAGIGHTEPLARRIAALKAYYAQMGDAALNGHGTKPAPRKRP